MEIVISGSVEEIVDFMRMSQIGEKPKKMRNLASEARSSEYKNLGAVAGMDLIVRDGVATCEPHTEHSDNV